MEDLPKLLQLKKKAGSHEKPVAIRVSCLKSVVTLDFLFFSFLHLDFSSAARSKSGCRKKKNNESWQKPARRRLRME